MWVIRARHLVTALRLLLLGDSGLHLLGTMRKVSYAELPLPLYE